MEQTSYWMWTRRKLSGRPLLHYDSWEEQAFAEDSAGRLGGCVWPPRSYSCSFCRREFRSAQALGGHMNVHRRDRARLKQSSTPTSENHERKLLGTQYPPQVSTLVYKSSPKPNLGAMVSTLSSSRVSTACTQEKFNELGRDNWRLREPSEDDMGTISRKRPRIDPMLPLFMKPSFGDQKLVQFEALELKTSVFEELDLELRLGDPPRVKYN